MDLGTRIEAAMERAFELTCTHAPPRLAEALRHAVFPGGARIRPRLCLAVSVACGEDEPRLGDAAAAALEFIHCASLVHDDLPCFDDAVLRRGRPSLHREFGEDLALLAGDGLIVTAFEQLARQPTAHAARLAELLAIIARASGPAEGIVAGQAWESEDRVDLERYHRSKSAALFRAATSCGAIAAGSPVAPWAACGELLGEAYQVADDLADRIGDCATLGKPICRDRTLGRPSAVSEHGLLGALAHLDRLSLQARDSIPPCADRRSLVELFEFVVARLCPPAMRHAVERVLACEREPDSDSALSA
ncbi:MAG: polyprenyl synthetase family protein [Deltaproteobacteria bacterium]|nr:polyprenyl synthetase family protein [Deltaproteobacteria bacterium]